MATTSTIPKSQRYLVILCGGTGPRLWPLSRAYHPKQFLKLFSRQTLLQTTVNRALSTVDRQNILVVSNRKYTNIVSKELSSLIPAQNLLFEPTKKNTTAAILYATAVIKSRQPNAIISVLPSDHFITNLRQFRHDILLAQDYALTRRHIVLIGIKPTGPDPSYGYILPFRQSVTKFVEKPDSKTAAHLIKDKALWNSGIYTFTIDTILSEVALHAKVYFSLFTQLTNHLSAPKMVQKIYKSFDNLPIDRALTEKSQRLSVINAGFDWNDIGEWQSIFLQLKTNRSHQNIVLSPDVKLLSRDSTNCLIQAPKDKLVTLLGIDNMAVIDTPDALLVCPLDQSFKVRDIVGDIVQSKYKNYFLGQNEKPR